jgi:hypothetical protein
MEPTDRDIPTDFAPGNFLSSFFLTAKGILLSPGRFYEGMNREGGLRNPFLFLTCCVLTHTLIVGLWLKNQSLIASNLLFGLVLPFVTAGILFFFITRLFKGSGTYETAFRVNAYASAVALLSWIPIVGILLEFYRVYLIVVGLSSTFSIKASRSFMAVVLTISVYMAASAALYHITGGPWPKAAP